MFLRQIQRLMFGLFLLSSSLIVQSLMADTLENHVQAEKLELRGTAPNHYTVQPGDTLWGIAQTFLHNPWMWPQLWHENPAISNPDLIYPGDQLVLIYDEQGQVRLQLQDQPLQGGSPVIKLSPGVRIANYHQAIPAIPLQKIAPFIERHQVFSPEQLDNNGYVLGTEDDRIATGLGDRVYVRGAGYSTLGSRYLVYRQQQAYLSDTQMRKEPEVLGYEMKYIGTVELEEQQSDIAVMRIVQSKEEIRLNDLVTLLDRGNTPAAFYPNAPTRQVEGSIISILGGVRYGGQYAVVAIDLGSIHRLVPGNVLNISTAREKTRDSRTGEEVSLPAEATGNLMVFRTFKRVSYGLVMKANKPVKVGDLLSSPESE